MTFAPNKSTCYLFAYWLLLLWSVRVLAAGEASQAGHTRLHVLIDDGEVMQAVGEVKRQLSSTASSSIDASRFRHSMISLPEVLQQEVGVQVRSTGGTGSLATVQLRGASSEQVVIYLDGVPLGDASGAPVDLSLIPLDSIERIDVYRGSTPLELATPSIGGAINIISRKSVDNYADNNVTASVGSFQTYKLAASSKLVKQDDDLMLSGSYLQSKNDFSFTNDNGTPDNPDDDRAEKRNNDGVKQLSVLANWKHRFSSKADSDIRLDITDRNKDIPGISNSPAMQTYVDTRQYNFLTQLNRRSLWRDNLNGNIKLFATRKEEVFDDSLGQLGFINQRSESLTRRLGTQLFGELIHDQSIWKLLNSYSIETYLNDSTQARVSGEDNRRKNVELSLENSRYFDEDRFIVNMVLRYQKTVDEVADGFDTSGKPVTGFDKRYRFINPQLGLKYRFTRKTFLSANIGQYSRVPSFFELFGGQGLAIGNPDLKQETSLNSDVGFSYNWFKPNSWLHDAQFYTGLFYNRIENLIVQIYNGLGVAKSVNISDATIRGLELTLKVTPVQQHSFDASYTLTDSVNDSEIGSFNGKALPNYYHHNLGLRYAWRYQKWLYRLDAELKRGMYYDRSNLLKGDDVRLVNTGLRYHFAASSIDFMANNLLDENIRYYRNRPTPGRSLSLTYSAVF